jgi:hypothetical protein
MVPLSHRTRSGIVEGDHRGISAEPIATEIQIDSFGCAPRGGGSEVDTPMLHRVGELRGRYVPSELSKRATQLYRQASKVCSFAGKCRCEVEIVETNVARPIATNKIPMPRVIRVNICHPGPCSVPSHRHQKFVVDAARNAKIQMERVNGGYLKPTRTQLGNLSRTHHGPNPARPLESRVAYCCKECLQHRRHRPRRVVWRVPPICFSTSSSSSRGPA